jgi:hypothetical protein
LTALQKILKKCDKRLKTTLVDSRWKLVTSRQFARSEIDEMLYNQAKALYRKSLPAFPEEPNNDEALALNVPVADTLTLDCLDLEAIPPGKISRFWITVSEDGLSLPIRVPVMAAKVN